MADDGTDGRLLAGRYRLGRVLGRGGMGTVWQAHDEMLGRDVAVKEVRPPEGLTGEQRDVLRRRVLREARAAARISSPSAVTVYDVVDEGGEPWLVLQLLPPRTLADVVAAEGPLPPARVAAIGLDLVDALQAAHRAGVLHRDVKPANVMLPEQRAVLTDFGIAVLDDDPGLTSTGVLVGSPAFMAPERARGEPPSPASDLWSLGAALFAAAEGDSPFRRDGQLPTLSAVLTDPVPPAVHAGPLQPVLAALLQRDPRLRPDADTTRQLLADALAAARAEQTAAEQVLPAPAAPGPSPTPAPAPTLATPMPTPRPDVPPSPRAPSRPGRGRAVGIAAVVLLVAVLAVAASTLRHPPGGGGAASAAAPVPTSGTSTTTASPSAAPSPAASSTPTPTAPAPSTSTAAPAPVTPSTSGDDQGGDDGGGTGRTYTDPTGFSLTLPTGWTVSRKGTDVYVRDPDSGAYLQIPQTTQPKPDALADWQQQERAASGRFPGYRRVRLQRVDYRGWDAADWEFTWTSSAGPVHVLSRNIRVSDRRAYALYWSVPADRWDALRPWFDVAARTFRPAS